MFDFLETIFSRVVGGIVASICAWLAVHYGLSVSATQQAQVTEHVIGIMLVVFSVLYPLLHKFISRFTNPADAAAPALVELGKTDNAAAKQ